MWAIDNLLIQGDLESAADLCDWWKRHWEERRFMGVPILSYVTRQAAYCWSGLGRPARAEHELLASAKASIEAGQSPADAYYELGRILERFEAPARAASAFEAAASYAGESELASFARRDAQRLNTDLTWMRPNPGDLASELLCALRSRDAARIHSLASKTHFSIGRGSSHFQFVEPAIVLPLLVADLRLSRIFGDASRLEGEGGRRYLRVRGWAGVTFQEDLVFLLIRTAHGWEWSGIITMLEVQGTRELYARISPPGISETNHQLEIRIEAPWREGVGYQAGGAVAYSFIRASGFGGLFLSTRECGFGPGGFYYNTVDQHEGSDAFAVDFTRWQRLNFITPQNYSDDRHDGVVLACADGIVTMEDRGTIASIVTGDRSGLGNRITQILFDSTTGSPSPYTAIYLHLRGPNEIFVSPTMRVRQGWILGGMDTTGNATYAHLHFEIHDRRMPRPDQILGASVRPSPMSEQTLNDEDSTKCIVSNNRVVLITPADCPSVPPAFFEREYPGVCDLVAATEARAILCAPGLALCRDRCVDLQTDPRNCGRCGLGCSTNDCRGGRCVF
ncbi:MAG: peptidoglycan DD-metalloendopeptidase family protein [Sandaracinaceae bacterium]|nr:peptidoglycan DD-metalloendopeptidase family protein [Sandaracinaceae bacterium]